MEVQLSGCHGKAGMVANYTFVLWWKDALNEVTGLWIEFQENKVMDVFVTSDPRGVWVPMN